MGGFLSSIARYFAEGTAASELGPDFRIRLAEREAQRRRLESSARASELTSALNSLSRMEELKRGFRSDAADELIATREHPGVSTEDAMLLKLASDRETARKMEEAKAALAAKNVESQIRTRESPPAPEEKTVTLEPSIARKLGLRPGVPYPLETVNTAESVYSSEGSERAARVRGSGVGSGGLAVDEKVLGYYSRLIDSDPAMISKVPSRKGEDIRTAVIKYRADRGLSIPKPIKVREAAASYSEAEAGLKVIEKAMERFHSAKWYNPVEANRARYSYVTQAKNYSTLIGRAREKGIVTEPDAQRFYSLIYPGLINAIVDPTIGREAVANAKTFLQESKVRRMAELTGYEAEAAQEEEDEVESLLGSIPQ